MKGQLESLGFDPPQRRVPAMVIPIRDVRGDIATHQIRPDEPRTLRGKVLKYETVRGSKLALDVPPGARPSLEDAQIPLIVTEGPLKADSAVGKGLCCVALLGVWGFKQPGVLAAWDHIPLKGREIVLVFDSDATTKRGVHQALSRLKAFLELRKAQVWVVHLPSGPDGQKVGLDDYLAAGHSADEVLNLASQDLVASSRQDELMVGPYRQTREGIFLIKETLDGPLEIPLTNFPARIITEIVHDDGADNESKEYEIEALVRGRRTTVYVPAPQFAGMGWVSGLGVGAVVYAGLNARDHARAAIQLSSSAVQAQHRYGHTGWRHVEGIWVFLSGSGAISNVGLDPSVQVCLPADLRGFTLPAPPTGSCLADAVRASLGLLELGPDTLLVPTLAAAYRAPLGRSDFGLHVYGETGAFKTELVALIEQHFGAALDAANLPAGWSSTQNALEGVLHILKDVVAVVDDLVLTGSHHDVARLMARTDRVFRAQANQTARLRMGKDRSIEAPLVPRGLILSTGEERPRGQSLAARRLDLEVRKGDIRADALTAAQATGHDGTYAATMSGFLQWLAPRFDVVERTRQERVSELRRQAQLERAHARTSTTLAQLALGWDVFLQFAASVGAISERERCDLWERAWHALLTVGGYHVAHQVDVDPVERFLALLRSAVNAGHAHLASTAGIEPAEPEVWGWRVQIVQEDAVCRPQGSRVGWVDGDHVYLDSHAAFEVVQDMAHQSHDPLLVERTTLHKQLHQRGLLVSVDASRAGVRYQIRKTIERKCVDVLHLHRDSLFPEAVLKVCKESEKPFEDADQHGQRTNSEDGVPPFGPPLEPARPRREWEEVDGNDIEPSQRPCFYAAHTKLWRGFDNQLICAICHPPPSTR
jgi:hypothetical protein